LQRTTLLTLNTVEGGCDAFLFAEWSGVRAPLTNGLPKVRNSIDKVSFAINTKRLGQEFNPCSKKGGRVIKSALGQVNKQSITINSTLSTFIKGGLTESHLGGGLQISNLFNLCSLL